jgi:hypothetical protein
MLSSAMKSDTAGSTGQPVRDSEGKKGSETGGTPILRISDAQEHTRVVRPTTIEDASTSPVKPTTQSSTLPKPLLSDYEKARLEGKSHLEAMYAQFSPAKNPPAPRAPRPLEPFPDPVLAYRCIMSRQDPLRPAPGFNSLG